MKMKKIITVLLLLVLGASCLFCFAGCEEEDNDSSTSTSASTSTESTTKKVDLDCTKLSSTLAYNKVYDIMNNSSNYTGKRVKIRGTYSRTAFTGGSTLHNFIDVYDNTACCSAFVTFTWSGHSVNELPESGTTITIIGKVTTLTENGNSIGNIKADTVTF